MKDSTILVPNREFDGYHREFSHWVFTINRTPSLSWRATVPEGVEIQLYFGTDLIAVTGSQQSGNLWIEGSGRDNHLMRWRSWWDYLSGSGLANGIWQVSDEIMIGDPQPPDEPVEFKFVEYLEKTASGFTNGEDWKPNPEDPLKKWIGLVFTCTDVQEQFDAQIAYEVFDITTWQGISMNEPRIMDEDDKPHPTGDTDRFFDFKVDNPFYPLEGDNKYEIKVFDTDDYVESFGDNNGGNLYSTRRYSIKRNVSVKGDTLWLIAEDYAAHAVVMTHGRRYTSSLRQKNRANPITGEPLWSVTVPRDNDGYQQIGINKGDYMADIWEEENAAAVQLPRNSELILDFYPFYLKNSIGEFSVSLPADMDTFLTGCGIEGDRFTNFEEYRGVHCSGDPDTPEYSSLIHKRLNPRKKNILIDWRRPFLPKDVRNAIPLFDNKLDPTEVFYVNAYISNDDNTRFINNRHVALNRIGASFNYVSCPRITKDPLPVSPVQNAISFWKISRRERNYFRQKLRENPNYPINPDRHPAWCASYNAPLYLRLKHLQYPEFHSRIVIVPKNLKNWKNTPGVYYWDNPLEWSNAKKNMIGWMFQHEIGHAVGIRHDPGSQSYMEPLIPIEYDNQQPDYGIFFPAGTIFNYSNSSKSEFSIVPPPQEQP